MTLLCVDDDPEDIEIFQDAVRKIDDNCICITARNGEEALHTLTTVLPDLIFMDINMPIMDGKEALRVIRSDKRFNSIPICILSTSTSRRELELCRLLGADRCLMKPNTFNEFISLLRPVLQKGMDKKSGGF